MSIETLTFDAMEVRIQRRTMSALITSQQDRPWVMHLTGADGHDLIRLVDRMAEARWPATTVNASIEQFYLAAKRRAAKPELATV